MDTMPLDTSEVCVFTHSHTLQRYLVALYPCVCANFLFVPTFETSLVMKLNTSKDMNNHNKGHGDYTYPGRLRKLKNKIISTSYAHTLVWIDYLVYPFTFHTEDPCYLANNLFTSLPFYFLYWSTIICPCQNAHTLVTIDYLVYPIYFSYWSPSSSCWQYIYLFTPLLFILFYPDLPIILNWNRIYDLIKDWGSLNGRDMTWHGIGRHRTRICHLM